jgi:type VI secretion system protein ImpL
VKLDINGTVVRQSGSNAPVAALAGRRHHRTAITVGRGRAAAGAVSALTFGAPPPRRSRRRSSLRCWNVRPWSLFRMLDAASPTRQGDRRDLHRRRTSLQYRFGAASVNPLTSPALREFRCPGGIWRHMHCGLYEKVAWA